MKIVIDSAVPFVRGVFEPYATVVYKDAEAICHEDLIDADALITRSRTRCGAELLDGTSVKIIATATISVDHIDLNYCQKHGIYVQKAAGSNAGGVMNYVFSALYACASHKSLFISGATLGIIGAGNTGARVARMGNYLGFRVLRCDPVRAEAEGQDLFVPMDRVLQEADIITMHVPLTSATRWMADSHFFARMKPGAIFINTANGDVVDERALKAYIPKLGAVILDTWSGEPNVDRELVDLADIATPHIAGYSYQGKQNATMAVVRAVARFLSLEKLYDFFPDAEVAELESIKLDLRDKSQGEVAAVLQYNYPIYTDDFMFRIAPWDFERLRQQYRYRREFYVDYNI